MLIKEKNALAKEMASALESESACPVSRDLRLRPADVGTVPLAIKNAFPVETTINITMKFRLAKSCQGSRPAFAVRLVVLKKRRPLFVEQTPPKKHKTAHGDAADPAENGQRLSPGTAGTAYREDTCCVCMVNLRRVTLIPCGHTPTCFSCYNRLIKTGLLCPLCRTPVAFRVDGPPPP